MPGKVPEDESMVDAQPLEDQEVDVEQQEYIEDEEDEEDEYMANDQQRITIVSFWTFSMVLLVEGYSIY